MTAHARRRDHDDSSDRRRRVQRRQNTANERDSLDFDESFVRSAGLKLGHVVLWPSRQHYGIQSGVLAKALTKLW